MDGKQRKKKEILELILAFSVTALVIGILITAFAKDNTPAGDAGRIIVIVSFIITAVCQMIIWFRRRSGKDPEEEDDME